VTDTDALRAEVQRLLPTPSHATSNWQDVTRRARVSRRRLWFIGVVVGIALAAAATTGALVLLAHPSDADTRPPATEWFSVFQEPPSTDDSTQAQLGSAPERGWDLGQLHILATGLGRFDSRLVAYPGNAGRNLCYALVGARVTDPSAGYCFSPSRPYAREDEAGEHFSVLALYGFTAGQPGIQLFGVAFDDVVSARVQISGEWRAVPVDRNGLYLDLPGVSHSDVGIFEATLQDGSVQRHDVRTGRRIS
jgi:hypothetical protein